MRLCRTPPTSGCWHDPFPSTRGEVPLPLRRDHHDGVCEQRQPGLDVELQRGVAPHGWRVLHRLPLGRLEWTPVVVCPARATPGQRLIACLGATPGVARRVRGCRRERNHPSRRPLPRRTHLRLFAPVLVLSLLSVVLPLAFTPWAEAQTQGLVRTTGRTSRSTETGGTCTARYVRDVEPWGDALHPGGDLARYGRGPQHAPHRRHVRRERGRPGRAVRRERLGTRRSALGGDA